MILKCLEEEPFSPAFIVSPLIIDSFPYTRNMHKLLIKAGIPIREYNINADIEQRMHGKWAVFDLEGANPEVMIGSISWEWPWALNKTLIQEREPIMILPTSFGTER